MIYVNEIDPYCAQWLQNLMDAGVLPAGHIDTRSIEDVTPNDLIGYTQCHFFAGLGGWIYALDLAGWPRDRPVWTGSCPCQPFSAAGKGAGFADERHLWPAWQHLIAQRKPATVFGEQVASKAVDGWIDLVHADMEGLGYAFGSVPFPSAGVGAPHIRDRLYWAADSEGAGKLGVIRDAGGESAVELRPQQERVKYDCGGWLGGVGHAGYDHDAGQEPTPGAGQPQADRPADQPGGSGVSPSGLGHAIGATSERIARGFLGAQAEVDRARRGDGRVVERSEHASAGMGSELAGATNGFWRDADWLGCRDGKWRPVEPGTFPLAHGVPGRVGRLRAYGNAINPHQAAEFVAAFMNADVRQELAAA